MINTKFALFVVVVVDIKYVVAYYIFQFQLILTLLLLK